MVPGVVEDIPDQGWGFKQSKKNFLDIYTFYTFDKLPLNAVLSSSTKMGVILPIFEPNYTQCFGCLIGKDVVSNTTSYPHSIAHIVEAGINQVILKSFNYINF